MLILPYSSFDYVELISVQVDRDRVHSGAIRQVLGVCIWRLSKGEQVLAHLD